MTVSLTHKFVSAKANGTDNTLVQPSNWNDTHALTCAANSVLGNNTGSTGNVIELSAGTAGLTVLAANLSSDLITALANAGISVPTTGDLKPTLKSTADAGWLMIDSATIGNTSSGATYTGSTYQALYNFLWNNYSSITSNTQFPVTGGIGGSAAADWAAQKPMQLGGQMIGRVMGVGSPNNTAGSGLTARAALQTVGGENQALATGNLPAHNHGINDPGHVHGVSDPGHGHSVNDPSHHHGLSSYSYWLGGGTGQISGGAGLPYGAGGGPGTDYSGTGISINGALTGISIAGAGTGISTQNTGSGTGFSIMQPTVFCYWMIKL